MGLFERRKRAELRSVIKEYYGGNIGFFAHSFASSIYDIPEVRTAIERFSDIFSSIPKYLERVDKNGNITYLENASSRGLTLEANPLQSACKFWKDLITKLLLNNNVFVEPIFDNRTGQLKQLYIIPSKSFNLKLNGDVGVVEFTDIGKTYRLNGFGGLIYINRFASIAGGKTNNLGLYETVVQSLAKQAINVANPKKVRALLQGKVGTSGALKDKDKQGTMKDVKANFDENLDGLAYLDSQWQVTPVNWQENDVNRELMQFVINIVYNYFGITQEIINNKASEIEFQMFVQTSIEPLAQQIEQEFTNKIFTQREIEFGNRVELDTFRLLVSTLTAKTAMFNIGLRQGVLNIDEAREMIGLQPLPDGKGQKIRVTADTVDIDIADEYQLGKFNIKKIKQGE